MKKKVLVILSALLVIIMTGCGADKGDKQPDSAIGESSQSEELAGKEDEIASLSVANDQFSFDQLVSQIGVKESELSGFLGATEVATAYSAELFGEEITINVRVMENTVQAIEIVFADVNADSVVIAISEQLGQDSEETDGVSQWTFDEKVILLSQNDTGCTVNIHK